jgi:predicted AlkP superfamily phosphohydrolase/phosphomutase/Flp pilus assembly protein TadD
MGRLTLGGRRTYRARTLKRLLLLVVLAALVPWSAGCARRRSRVLVAAIDGLDPQTVDLLVSEGKLPNFARLRSEGAYAPMESQEPLLSPVIWTTIATGKSPDEHRIGHVVAVNEKTGEPLPVTSRMRRVKAIWNILSESKRKVDVIGWWATWPAESINGSMVSDHFAYHFLFEEGLTGGPDDATGKTSPPELMTVLQPDVKRPKDLTRAELARYVDVPDAELQRPFDLKDDLSEFRWALATMLTHRNAALRLWKRDDPDDLLVYFEGVDSTSHLFGHLFRAGPLAGELEEQRKRYGRAVEQMYLLADEIVGDLMKAAGKDTTLVVLSDHGFQLGALPDDPSKLRDMRRVSEAFHRKKGILYLWGRKVRSRARLDAPTILDVAPTILALNGVPPARDMKGRVLTEGLTLEPSARVATYETGSAVASGAAPAAAPATDARVDPEVMKRLASLGYLHATSPTGDRNIAAVLFEQGKFAESAAEYAKLVKQKPEDAGLHASLAGALGALGRYDAAKKEIDESIRLDPLNPEAYHNRGVLHERAGDRAAAVADYRKAIEVNPRYDASRSALTRLGETVAAPAGRSAEEARAASLAEQAAELAKRGDYPGATRLLDEAAKLGPRLPLVWQYRANVRYPAGDRAGAISALEQGHNHDPTNVLFAENQIRLKGSGPAR